MARQAWKTMLTGMQGPVVLDVPFDIFKEAAVEETPDPEDWTANISSRYGADPDGVGGVSIDRPGDLGDAIQEAITANKPYLIDANIAGDMNPPGAGVWELPGIGVNKPAVGTRYVPGK
jgi:thiamine pyrophosphate-dependent acetolactate synthase large subunit-like protein